MDETRKKEFLGCSMYSIYHNIQYMEHVHVQDIQRVLEICWTQCILRTRYTAI